MAGLLDLIGDASNGLVRFLNAYSTPNVLADQSLIDLAGPDAEERARKVAQARMISGIQGAAARNAPWYALQSAGEQVGQDAYGEFLSGAAQHADLLKQRRDRDAKTKNLQDLIAMGKGLLDENGDPQFTDSQLQALQLLPEEQQAQILGGTIFPKDRLNKDQPIQVSDGYLEYDRDQKKWIFHRTYQDRAAQGAASAIQPNQSDLSSMAYGIAHYQVAPPSPRQLTTPNGMALMALVRQINPEYRAYEYKSRSDARTRFTSGRQGDQVRSFNVSIDHLATLQDLSKALANGDMPTANYISNLISTNYGSPEITSFETAKQIVADEVMKGIIGGQMAVDDREKAAENIRSSSSPAQFEHNIEALKALLGGQLNGLRRQYRYSTQLNDFADMLSQDARQYLHDDAPAGASPAASGGPRVAPGGHTRSHDVQDIPTL